MSNAAGMRPQHPLPVCIRLSAPAAEFRPLGANAPHPEKLMVLEKPVKDHTQVCKRADSNGSFSQVFWRPFYSSISDCAASGASRWPFRADSVRRRLICLLPQHHSLSSHTRPGTNLWSRLCLCAQHNSSRVLLCTSQNMLR